MVGARTQGPPTSYGALNLPGDGVSGRAADSATPGARQRVISVAGLVLVGLALTAIVATMASRTGYHQVQTVVDPAFAPAQLDTTIVTRGRPQSPTLWRRINEGPLRPFQFDSNDIASSQLSAHENPRQNGIWTVDTKGDYSLPESQWKVHHQDLPSEGKDDNTWRAGYKWAITKAAVDDSGWGPCYPACGESVQFREVVCIRSDETVVDDSFCSQDSQPTLRQACNNYSLCHPCWEVSDWNECVNGAGDADYPVCNRKYRSVKCRFCEPEGPSPELVTSPMHKIDWFPQDWELGLDEGRGVSGGSLVMGRQTFAEWFATTNGLPTADSVTADAVCQYGRVGICDTPSPPGCTADSDQTTCAPTWDTVKDERLMDAFFCGFNVAPEDCDEGRSVSSQRFAKYHGGDLGPAKIQNGYDCNVMSTEYTPENMAFLTEEAQAHALTCDDPTRKACREWTNPMHHSYPDRPYHMLGPFDNFDLTPSHEDECINFEDSGGTYKWWYMEWEDPRVHLCWNDTWWNEEAEGGARWWYGCNEENINGWSDPEDPEDLLRLAAPFEQQDLLGEGHKLQTCGMAFDARPYRCCREIQVGTCEVTDARCYCGGAIAIFEEGTFNHQKTEEGDVHPDSYCPLMDDSNGGVFSRMFSSKAFPMDPATGKTTETDVGLIPVVRREKCQQYEAVWECEAYPNQNALWPPQDYTLGANANDERDFGTFYRNLEAWIMEYNSYDPYMEDFGIRGFNGAGVFKMGCLRQQLEHTCTRQAKFDDCTGVWQCNCWRECDPDVTKVVSKQDPGYIMPRDGSEETESYPADGEVDVGTEDKPLWEKVTDRTECQECHAECGMSAHQCRQCWCEYLPTWAIIKYGYFQNPGSSAVLMGDYTHMAQYAVSEIDPTGERCYRPWEGYGTPKPEELRSCVNPEACTFVWCVDEHFADCGLGCGPQHEDRDIGCCRMDGVAVDPSLCEPNPIGTQWELIMQMGDAEEDQPLGFESHYWEDAEETLFEVCADKANRKLHAFNSRKYNKMKMCFGYGFEVTNPDFEDDVLTSPVQDPAVITGWTSLGEPAVLIKSNADGIGIPADDGTQLAAIYAKGGLSTIIDGLAPGMLTIVTIALGSKSEEVGAVNAELLLNGKVYMSIAEIPTGGLKTYRFHFTPTESSVTLVVRFPDGPAALRCGDDYCLLLDNLRVTSEGYELVGQDYGFGGEYPLRDLSIATPEADDIGDPVLGGDNLNIGPAREFANDWDEVLMISGGNHDMDDSNGDGEFDMWYKFKPTQDLFGESDGSDMIISDVRSNDASLMAVIKEDGGAKMCRAPDGFQAAWSLNGLMDGATRDPEGGCARDECLDEVPEDFAEQSGYVPGECNEHTWDGQGVYYAGAEYMGSFMGWRGDGQMKGFTQQAWSLMRRSGTPPLLQIFVRKSNAHGATDETQANCIVYTFGATFQNATTLFTMGPVKPGGTLVPETFYRQEWARVFAQPDTACDDLSCAEPGFNLGIDNYVCGTESGDDLGVAANNADNAHFARWGIRTKAYCNGEADGYDAVVGLGLKSGDVKGRDCTGAEFNTHSTDIGAGWSSRYLEDMTDHYQKAWMWIADSTQNLAIDGFKLLPPFDWNEPDFKVLDGEANIFPTVDGCKRKCSEMEDCIVGTYVSGSERHGQCWLASKIANKSNTDFCGADADKQCIAFQKLPVMKMRTCNGYVYESHMVLPGGEDWDLNKFFPTGMMFEVKEGQDSFAETIFGPVAVREVISKQFSYGKQTYVYWMEDVVNLATLRSKCVFTHKRNKDTSKFQQWPGRIVECDVTDAAAEEAEVGVVKKYMSTVAAHRECSEKYNGHKEGRVERDPVTGAYATNFKTEVHMDPGQCHGFSEWVNPELLTNGDFEEFPVDDSGRYVHTTEAFDQYGWIVEPNAEDEDPKEVMVETISRDEGASYPASPPEPFSCSTCTRFLDLNNNGPGEIYQEFLTQPYASYILSMWVSADWVAQGNEDDPEVKTATVTIMGFDGEPCLEQELRVDVTGWDAELYRWKYFAWEFNPTPPNGFLDTHYGAVDAVELRIKSTNSGMGGILLDAVSVKMAHPGEIENLDVEECAVLGTDFEVDLEGEETLHTFQLRDRQIMQNVMCSKIDEATGDIVFPPWWDCQDNVGAVSDDSTTRRYKNCEPGWTLVSPPPCDTSFVQVFGGTSDLMDEDYAKAMMETVGIAPQTAEVSVSHQMQTQCYTARMTYEARNPRYTNQEITACSPSMDPKFPWENPLDMPGLMAVFEGWEMSKLTTFTYRLTFNSKATIENIRVGGAKFAGTKFQLLSSARTPISTREIDIDDGHFLSQQCGGMPGTHCVVIVPGSAVHAEEVYFFEETSSEPKARIRTSFCVRTPVIYLHTERGLSSLDPHSREPAGESLNACDNGLYDRIDTLDENFRTQIVEDKCWRSGPMSAGKSYGVPKDLGEARAARFLVPGKGGHLTIGMFDHEQPKQRDVIWYEEVIEEEEVIDPNEGEWRNGWFYQGSPEAEDDEDDEEEAEGVGCNMDPAYFIQISGTEGAGEVQAGIRITQGYPGEEGSTILAEDNSLTGYLGEGQRFFWVDQYFDESDSSWSIRVGAPAHANEGERNGLHTLPIGVDVLLQYKFPPGEDATPISHIGVEMTNDMEGLDFASQVAVCTDGEVGRPDGERTCVDWSGCSCGWLDPNEEIDVCVNAPGCTDGKVDGVNVLQKWENIPCSNNCGDGTKVRSTDCVIRSDELSSTLCRAQGTECPIFTHSSNPACMVTFYDAYVDGYGEEMNDRNYEAAVKTFSQRAGARLNIADLAFARATADTSNFAPSTVLVEGFGCQVVLWSAADGWEDYEDYGFGGFEDSDGCGIVQSYRVTEGERLIIGQTDGDEAPRGAEASDAEYASLPRCNGNAMRIMSFSVAGLNDNLCTESTKPATQITCSEDRGCCYVAVYGKWHEGEGNTMQGEEDTINGGYLTHFCMNLDNDCDCDDEVGLECRDVLWEKRKYQCQEWVEDTAHELDGYYLRLTRKEKMKLQRALQDFLGEKIDEDDVQHGKPICKHKQYVDTKAAEVDFGPRARSLLQRWQYTEGCPETSNGPNAVNFGDDPAGSNTYGAVAKGSAKMTTNAHFEDATMMDSWECSGDAHWFPEGTLIGGEHLSCPEPLDNHPANEPRTGGPYPQECRNCGRAYTEHWCKCHWDPDEWGTCEGCGDVLISRHVNCVRIDHDPDTNPQVRDCNQAMLDTFGSCCYAPLFFSACGGCLQTDRPNTQKHCIDTTQCTYEWHVKVNDELCDTFNKCVPWSEWTVDDRSSGALEDQKTWCTAGPQRGNSDSNFVTYGLGACWLPTTREHSPTFETSDAWSTQGLDECSCYYGSSKGMGSFTFGPNPLDIKGNSRVSQRVEMADAGWVTSIAVAVEGANDQEPTSMKGSIYTDHLGSPGERVAVTKEAINTQGKREWVEMEFLCEDQDESIPDEFRDTKKCGVYLGTGFFWLTVNVEKKVQFMGFDGNSETTVGMLTVDEPYAPGNRKPALDFGAGTTLSGSFSIHASVTPDAETHVYPDLSMPCTEADTCQQCMRILDSREEYEGERCGWMLKTSSSSSSLADTADCEPRRWMQERGYDEDLSCHQSWGEGMFMELEHWYCDGEKGRSPYPNGVSHATSLEMCAEECKLANTHWYQYAAFLQEVPEDQQDFAFYCKGFAWEDNADGVDSAKCTLYKKFDSMTSTAHYAEDASGNPTHELVVNSANSRCFVQKELPNACGIDRAMWMRSNGGDFYYKSKDGFFYKVQPKPSGALPQCDGESVFGGELTEPRDFCNGYAQGGFNPNNPPDITCSKCIDHALDHNLLGGLITGGTDGSGGCSALEKHKVTRCGGGEPAKLSCAGGTHGSGSKIHIVKKSASWVRRSPEVCPDIPVDAAGEPRFGNINDCGRVGNVMDTVKDKCQGKRECEIEPNDSTLGSGGCPKTYKYFQVEYKCI